MKSQGEKSAGEMKQLREKIISLNSTIELRDFQVGQHELQIASLKEGLSEAKEELQRKKQESIKLGDRLQEYKNQDLYTSQNIEILKSEKEFL
jgi:chromosome segregation ATPase